MQDAHPSCQLDGPRASDLRRKSPHSDGTRCHTPTLEIEQASDYSDPRDYLVHGSAHEIEHTASRRSGPRRWLRAVVWLIAAGLHPRAGATTQRLAADLATRMNYDTGHALYDLDGTARRLGVDRSTVKRHARYLRELGALVWVSHGTQHNSRRPRGLKGYAGTATVYAATIPAVYDHAMGHRIVGTGYGARIVVDQRGQIPAQGRQEQAEPVDNLGAGEGRAPLSLTWVEEGNQVQVVGGDNYTSRKRATSRKPSTLKTSSKTGRRSPAQVARDIRIARQVRPRVNWTQPEGLRRLAFALRPLIDQGHDADSIATELHSFGLTWRPAAPAAFIRCELARRARNEERSAYASAGHLAQPMTPAQWQAYHHQQALAAAEQAAARFVQTGRTDDERRAARADARQDFGIVADHIADHGLDDAIDLYGCDLVTRADRLMQSGGYRMGGIHA